MQTETDARFIEAHSQHEHLQATLKYLSESVNKEIQSAVRKSQATIKAQIQSSMGGGGGGGLSNLGTGIGLEGGGGELKKLLL